MLNLSLEAVIESLELAKLGRSEVGDLESSEIYREIFGEEFPLFDEEESDEKKAEANKIPLEKWSHAQKPVWTEKLQKPFKVRVDAFIYDESRKSDYQVSTQMGV